MAQAGSAHSPFYDVAMDDSRSRKQLSLQVAQMIQENKGQRSSWIKWTWTLSGCLHSACNDRLSLLSLTVIYPSALSTPPLFKWGPSLSLSCPCLTAVCWICARTGGETRWSRGRLTWTSVHRSQSCKEPTAGPEGDGGLWSGCKDRMRRWVVSLVGKHTYV